MAGLYLLIGCDNGCIYYIGELQCNVLSVLCHSLLFIFFSDMEKFPVRMKDNDLLVTQLFEDPFKEAITALSVFMPPTCCEDHIPIHYHTQVLVYTIHTQYLPCPYRVRPNMDGGGVWHKRRWCEGDSEAS